MKEFWSSRIRDMEPYTPGEQPKGRSFIKLNTNENPYPPSPMVRNAIQAAADDALRLYPDPDATALRQALAEAYGLKVEQIFVGNGSDEVLAFCFQAFFDPAKTVLFPDVTYSFYPVYARLFGLRYEEVPLDECYGLPLEPFVGGDSGGVVVASPNAPTGREVPLTTIRALVEGNPHAVVVVDEAYVDFGGHSAVELIDRYPNLVVVQTMSKSRSLAGLRVGYAMGQKNLMDALHCVKNSFNSYTLDRLALAGAEAALRDVPYFQASVAKICATRARFAAQAKALGFLMCDSATNFIFLSHPQVPAKTLLDGLRERGILVRWWNKPRIENYLRVTVGTDREMDTLLAALKELV